MRGARKGEVPASIVIRIPYGGGVRAPELHSDSPEALFAHVPGLKVVCPTTPQDARDMLVAAIADPDPVIFMEPKRIYRAGREEVPDELPFELGNGERHAYNEYLSKARVARDGNDLAIITYGATVPLVAARRPRGSPTSEGIEARVVDLRSLLPARRRRDRRGRVRMRASAGRPRGSPDSGTRGRGLEP